VSWFVGARVVFAVEDEVLVPSDAGLRPVGAADRHVTLLFLGSVPEDTARRVWRSIPPLRLPAEVHARRWQRFGRSALALELADDDGLLEAAAEQCHRAAAEVVTDLERPAVFRPHVTLARVPRRGRAPSARRLGDWPMPARALSVVPPALFRSNPQPTGDRYEGVEQQPGG
jgi:2'-5' RNA ligase